MKFLWLNKLVFNGLICVCGFRFKVGLMASKLQQLQSKACQATKFLSQHGNAYYKQLLEQNKQYIQEPPTVEKCNLLAKQLLYTRLARYFFFSCTFVFIAFDVNFMWILQQFWWSWNGSFVWAAFLLGYSYMISSDLIL